MAARYFIGTGNRNWNDTANWSATSGGVGGASVPTMNDDVYFDSNSGTGTVTVNTIANMRDCTFAQIQLITLANAAYPFNIFGNWTLCSNAYLATSFTGTGYVYLKATTSVNITSNGCTRTWNRLHFDGVDGIWTLQDDTIFNNVIISTSAANKKLYMNNFNLTVAGWAGVVAFTIYGGSGTLTAPNWNYNANLVPDTGTVVIESGTITGGNGKFYNLHIIQNTGAGSVLYVDLQIANNLIIQGNSNPALRYFIFSSTIGTPRKIICNGTVTASNVDFRDIVGAGTANWDLSNIAGGSGDCGGNSGITFTPAQTQYFKHTLGAVNWRDVTKWFSNYERTIAGRVPLPQDDAIFDENSFTGESTLNVNVPRIGGLNMEGVNQITNLSLLNNIECYGSYILGLEITHNVNFGITLLNRTDSFLKTFYLTMPVVTFGRLSSYTLLSNFYSEKYIQFSGAFKVDFNDYNLTATEIVYNSSVSHFYMGNGVITLQGTPLYSGIVIPANNLYCENSLLILNHTNVNTLFTLDLFGKTYNKIRIIGENSDGYNILRSNTINELIIDSGRKVRFTNGTTQTINKLTAIGTPEQPITIGSTTAGQRHTINYTGSEASTVEYCNISDSKVTQARRLLAKNSVNVGNNQNWGFEELPPLALNFGQVDKMYVGGSEVVSAYYGEVKIK